MADMTTIKGRIRETIYPNGTGAISADKHQALLLEMVDEFNNKKADKTDITTPDWNITNPSENGYILNRTHGIDARLRTAKGTLTELLGGVFSQYVRVIHYDNGELLIRHLYLNGVVVEPEVGKEYSVAYSGPSVFAKIEEDGVGGYDILLKGGSDTGAIVEISVVTIKKLDSPYIPNEIARMEQVDEVREETLAIWEHLDDGYAPNFAVGVADQLAGQDEPTASEINFRRSGGGAILDGNARIEAIKGNSLVWNQKVQLENTNKSTSLNGVTITDNRDGSFTVVTEATGATADVTFRMSELGFWNSGHKYCVLGCPAGGSESTYYMRDMQFSTYYLVDYGQGCVSIAQNSKGMRPSIIVKSGTIITTPITFRPRYHDLTQMFQAGNEPTTIEEYNARKPIVEDEYAYNEGEVIHMDVQSIESVGVNQWDEEWRKCSYDSQGNYISTDPFVASKNPMKVLPNKEYHFSHKQGNGVFVIFWYDNNMKFISRVYLGNNATTISPNGACYMNFRMQEEYGLTYNHDICINLSDASINGKYFPYVKRMQSLDIIRKYFPNGMKSAGTAHDEIRYNKATQKWEYSKGRFKSADLGELNWEYDSTNSRMYTNDLRDYIMKPSGDWGNTLLCAKYVSILWNSSQDKFVTLLQSGRVYIKDTDYTDAASFKAAMAGVILYYESNDWEWVELDKEDQLRNFDYQVWNCGTEKALAEGQTSPLKADIVYGFNAYGTIKQLKEQMATLMTQMAQMQTAMASNIVE